MATILKMVVKKFLYNFQCSFYMWYLLKVYYVVMFFLKSVDNMAFFLISEIARAGRGKRKQFNHMGPATPTI